VPLSRPRRRVLIAIGTALLLLGAAFAVLHTAPVRARMLALLEARLARIGIVATADALEYNLATRDVRVRGLRLAVASNPRPFLTAGEVHAVLGWGVFAGRIDIDRLDLSHARVDLVRTADGRTNWPRSQGEAAGQRPRSSCCARGSPTSRSPGTTSRTVSRRRSAASRWRSIPRPEDRPAVSNSPARAALRPAIDRRRSIGSAGGSRGTRAT
jgi:hypothetical protein